jgi:hypothetical protein
MLFDNVPEKWRRALCFILCSIIESPTTKELHPTHVQQYFFILLDHRWVLVLFLSHFGSVSFEAIHGSLI